MMIVNCVHEHALELTVHMRGNVAVDDCLE